MLSAQNCLQMIECSGLDVLVTLMKMPSVQLHFELYCDTWKLLRLMIESVLTSNNKVSGTLFVQTEKPITCAHYFWFSLLSSIMQCVLEIACLLALHVCCIRVDMYAVACIMTLRMR